MAILATEPRRALVIGFVGALLSAIATAVLDLQVHEGVETVTGPARYLYAGLGGALLFVLLDPLIRQYLIPSATMWESGSRLLFAAEVVLIGFPTVAVTIPFAAGATFLLTPITIYGLGATILKGGPEMWQDLWTGLGLLWMSFLGLCGVVATSLLTRIGAAFLVHGRAGLKDLHRSLCIGAVSALPTLTFWSGPKLWHAVVSQPYSGDSVVAALFFGAIPLLIPAFHVGLEAICCSKTNRLSPNKAELGSKHT